MSNSMQTPGLYRGPDCIDSLAIPFSKGSSQPRDGTHVSHMAGGSFTIRATREAPEYWNGEPAPSPEDCVSITQQKNLKTKRLKQFKEQQQQNEYLISQFTNMSVEKQKTFISGVSFFCCFSILECSADQREMLICSCSHYRKKKSLIKVWRGHQHIIAHQNFLKFTKRVEILKGDALRFSKFDFCTVSVTYAHTSDYSYPLFVGN